MEAVELPAWVFHETGVGCGVSGHHADCLCDVHIGTPVPVDNEAGMMFGQIAADVWGGVSSETIYDFASTLFGCYQMFRDEIIEWIPADDPETMGSADVADGKPRQAEHEINIGKPGKRKVMSQLSRATLWTFRHGWTWGIPWSKIKPYVPEHQRSLFARVYSERLYHPRTRKARLG